MVKMSSTFPGQRRQRDGKTLMYNMCVVRIINIPSSVVSRKENNKLHLLVTEKVSQWAKGMKMSLYQIICHWSSVFPKNL